MLWWRAQRSRRISRGPDGYERPKNPVDPARERTPEENVAALNYQSEEPEQDAGELARGAWSATVAIAGIFALVMLIGLVIFVGSHAGTSWHEWRAAPLQHAAGAGDVAEIGRLIERGADPNRAGPGGETPLIAALREGQLQGLEVLLAAGAVPTQDAIDVALRYRRRDALIAMIEAGADPDTRSAWSTKSLLEIATEQGDAELVKLLLEHGADPDAAPGESPFTMPALVIAANKGEAQIARLLLEHGADPTLRREGWTAADVALQAGHAEVAQMLRAAAKNTNEAGHSG